MKTIVLIFITALLILPNSTGYKIGDVASDFSLPSVNDTNISLSDYNQAKGFIIIFTCNTCPYSVAYEDRINELEKKYRKDGFQVIAINPNDPIAQKGESMIDMKLRSNEKQFTFPYLQDNGQLIYPRYGATRTPHVFVLEKTTYGNIVRYIGAIDNNSRNPELVTERYVENAVNNLLKGELPKKTQTKAIGCSIKTL
jgi:peroxiredoxin